MASDIETSLREGLSQIDLTLDDQQIRQLVSYAGELELWNPTHKLVAADLQGIIDRHILDSLAPCSLLKSFLKGGERAADIGSGNGMPGIPLAVALPELPFTLIERSGRRVDFLRNAAARMRLSDSITIVHRDLEEVRQQYEILVLRAFRPFDAVITDLDAVLAPGGMIFAYKGKVQVAQDELSSCDAELLARYEVEILPYQAGAGDQERCILKAVKKRQ